MRALVSAKANPTEIGPLAGGVPVPATDNP
jgi:hypothetical protein